MFALGLGALLLLVAAAGTAVLVMAPARQLEVSPAVLVTGGGGKAIIEAHNTPSIAVDPADDRHLVLAEKLDRPRFGCRVHVSWDGGSRWEDSQVQLPPGRDTCFIPDVAFSRGNVLLLFLTLNTQTRDPLSGGNDPNGTYISSSADGGRTFAPPITLNGPDNLQPRLAVDRGSDRIYIVYLQGSPLQNDTPLGLGPPPNPLMASSSTDGGRSFGPPVQVNDPRRARVGAPSVAVAPNGDLLVLYQDSRDDLEDYNNKAAPFQGTFELVLARSSDHGTTFRESVVDNAEVRPHPFLIYLPPTPSLAVAPEGRDVYAAWSDARGGAADVLIRHSSDGGRTWAAPRRVNDRGSGPESYELPALAASSAGTVECMYYAFKGAVPRGHVEYAVSADGGNRFGSRTRVSADFDATIGVPSPRDLGASDFGARLAMVRLRSGTLLAWADTIQGSRDTGRVDINVARVKAL
ncbi:MAG: hypothetical protein NVSMB17_06770 [Candidatus Dormibacteria bacterium]